MKLGKLFLLTGAFLVMTNIANAKLPGYTDGAELMQPKIENGQIDFSQVCERSSQWCELRYSQVQTAH